MGVKHQKIEGTKIINEIDSTNIVKTTYDTADNSLVAEFKNGTKIVLPITFPLTFLALHKRRTLQQNQTSNYRWSWHR